MFSSALLGCSSHGSACLAHKTQGLHSPAPGLWHTPMGRSSSFSPVTRFPPTRPSRPITKSGDGPREEEQPSKGAQPSSGGGQQPMLDKLRSFMAHAITASHTKSGDGPREEEQPSKGVHPSSGGGQQPMLDKLRSFVALHWYTMLAVALTAGGFILMPWRPTGHPRLHVQPPATAALSAEGMRDLGTSHASAGHPAHVGSVPATDTEPAKGACSAGGIFDRHQEKALLEAYVKEVPEDVLVLLGPRNCGKSTLMQWMLDQGPQDCGVLCDLRLLRDTSPGQLHELFINIGMPRAMQSPSAIKTLTSLAVQEARAGKPGTVIRFLVSTASRIPVCGEAIQAAIDIAQRQAPTGIDVEKMVKSQKSAVSSAADFVQAYADLWHLLGIPGYPVIILDEANLMMPWSEGDQERKEALQGILANFVRVTKQTNRCHVILVTSDFGFLTWLEQAIGKGYSRVEVVTPFKEDDAKDFFQHHLRRLLPVGSSTPEAIDSFTWSRIYDVCGGDPHLLRKCAKDVAAGRQPHKTLDAAKDEASQLIRQAVGTRHLPERLYPAFARIVTAIVDSPAHAISWDRAAGLIDHPEVVTTTNDQSRAQAVKGALNNLVRHNLFLARPFSDWAGDDAAMKSEVFGEGLALFPPGQTMLHKYKEIKPDLLAAAEEALKEERPGDQSRS